MTLVGECKETEIHFLGDLAVLVNWLYWFLPLKKMVTLVNYLVFSLIKKSGVIGCSVTQCKPFLSLNFSMIHLCLALFHLFVVW